MSKISVCMTTFNGEQFILDQLRSIIRNISHSDQIIISDDSSNDKTIELIESLNDNRITILRDNKYNGPQSLDNVISYTWRSETGGPSGENEKELPAII